MRRVHRNRQRNECEKGAEVNDQGNHYVLQRNIGNFFSLRSSNYFEDGYDRNGAERISSKYA